MSAFTDAVRLARESWPKPIGLAIGWVATLLAGLALHSMVPSLVLWPAIFCVGLILTFLWVYNRSLKRCPKDKFGFVIAISVDDPATQAIFDRDFCKNLELLLTQGQLSKNLWVYQVPQFQLPQALTIDRAQKLRLQTKSNFLLYGQVRTRQEDRKKYYLDLDGLVAHAETTEHNKSRLSLEFREVLPKRTIVEAGSELPEFELRSSLSSIAAKYIVGIAASISGYLDYADVMYADALALALPIQNDQPLAKLIVERIPYRFVETVLARARTQYMKWRQSYSEADFEPLASLISAAPVEAQRFPEWKALSAICFVVKTQENWVEVEKLISSGSANDPSTEVNLAFVTSARGDLRSAARHYRKALELNINLDTIDEIMSFLEWYKEYREAYKAEIFFDLGFISYCLLRDHEMASGYFAKFNEFREGRYETESELVEKWLRELSV